MVFMLDNPQVLQGERIEYIGTDREEEMTVGMCRADIARLQAKEAEKLAQEGKGELAHSNQLGKTVKKKVENIMLRSCWNLETHKLQRVFDEQVASKIKIPVCRDVFRQEASSIIEEHQSVVESCGGISLLGCKFQASQKTVDAFNRLAELAGNKSQRFQMVPSFGVAW